VTAPVRKNPRTEDAGQPVAQQVRDALRAMLLDGALPPGAPIRQEVTAEQLRVSRIPVREALRMLEAEGVVRYEKNVGYSVARLSRDDLRQNYLLRRILETGLVHELRPAAEADLSALVALNNDLASALERGNVADSLRLNKRFHFAMFELAELRIVSEEISRVWLQSDSYRAVILYAPESAERVVSEHAEMIELLARGDTDDLIAAMDHHRSAGERRALQMFDLLARRGNE
jgi:DNA-binding GntR family transcriptional regulator